MDNMAIIGFSILVGLIIGSVVGYVAFYNQGPPLSQIQKESLQAEYQTSINEASANCTEAYQSKCITELKLTEKEVTRLRKYASESSEYYDKLISKIEGMETNLLHDLDRYAMPKKGLDMNCIKWQSYDLNARKSFDSNKWIVIGRAAECIEYKMLQK
jgi:hypothetical protein